jgi:hypothetical protein
MLLPVSQLNEPISSLLEETLECVVIHFPSTSQLISTLDTSLSLPVVASSSRFHPPLFFRTQVRYRCQCRFHEQRRVDQSCPNFLSTLTHDMLMSHNHNLIPLSVFVGQPYTGFRPRCPRAALGPMGSWALFATEVASGGIWR